MKRSRLILFVALLGLGLSGCMQPTTTTYPARSTPASSPYALSYEAGGFDASGAFMGGTEFMNLQAFDGRLYAGVGYWEESSHAYPRGAQILVLDPEQVERQGNQWIKDHWQVETQFPPQYSRISSLGVATFHHYNSMGQPIGTVAQLLIVGLDGINGALYAQMSPGHWVDLHAPTPISIRSFAVHYDPSTHADRLFVGAGRLQTPQGAIFSGAYTPSPAGLITWNTQPEISGFRHRVMSFTECGGNLFFSAKPSIYERDDATHTWHLLYSYPITNAFDDSKYASGFRSLTCIDDPTQPGQKALLTSFEGVNGDILRINITSGVATLEVRLRQFLAQKWGAALRPHSDIIAGYNDLLDVSPGAGSQWLFGVLAYYPGPASSPHSTSAWFLARTSVNGQIHYTLYEVPALNWLYPRSDTKLYSVRAMAISPFAADQGNVLYVGGYDGHFRPDHNTAWLYRVDLSTALAKPV